MAKQTIRKDNRGRVLRTGEQQRKDGSYMFTYVNSITNKKCYVYSWRLEKSDRMPDGKRLKPSLRELEAEIVRKTVMGLSTGTSDLTVEQLVTKYLETKKGQRDSTLKGYKTVTNFLETQPQFYGRRIDLIKRSDAIAFLTYLQNDLHKSYSSIHNIRGVLRPAFQMVVDDDILLKNPFEFELKTHLNVGYKTKEALTTAQKKFYLDFIMKDDHYSKYYPFFYILFETGLRVSEFCGLTLDDIDFDKKLIHVRHQLRHDKEEFKVTVLKTETGLRDLRLTPELEEQFRALIAQRPKFKKEIQVAEYNNRNKPTGNKISGFLTFNRDNNPNVAHNIEQFFRWAWNKYERLFKVEIPKVTPHICRHTFATDLYIRGISVKSAQYLLGHGDVRTTLKIYTDTNADTAYKECDEHPEVFTNYDELWGKTEEDE